MESSPRKGPALVVALTGGIGSGKTSVSDRLASLGATVIDADVIAHELTGPGGKALEAIAAEFGSEVLDAERGLDRAAMRRLVFADAAARQRLEAILHPRIRSEMNERLSRAAGPYAVLVIPLLFETGQVSIADRILVVDSPESLQVQRVRERSGLDVQEVRRILKAQVSRSVRVSGADDLIDNSGSRDHLLDQVDSLHARYLSLSAPS
jgi:dephospho-CoA kinase